MNDYKWLFIFKIKGIKDYILATNELKDIVEASEIIVNITEKDFYEKILESLDCIYDIDYKVIKSVADCLIFLFCDKEKLENFMNVWVNIIKKLAPSVKYVYDFFPINSNNIQEIYQTAIEKQTSINQQQYNILRESSLPTERGKNRRNNLERVSISKDTYISKELQKKLESVLEFHSKLIDNFIPNFDYLEPKFNFKELNNPSTWPSDFREITDYSDNNYMAVVYIDVNSMGEFFRILVEKLKNKDAYSFLKINKAISECLLSISEESAKESILTIIEDDNTLLQKIKTEKKFPFRPLFLDGNRLIFVIKSSYAVRFSEAYMFYFNQKSKQEFSKLFDYYQLAFNTDIADFKISAGIAFTKSNYPFKSAYELCENLCKQGKDLSDRLVSTITFYLQNNTVDDDLDDTINNENIYKDLELSYRTYALEDNNKNLPNIVDLTDIVSILNNLPIKPLKELTNPFCDKSKIDLAWLIFKTNIYRTKKKIKEFKTIISLLRNITRNQEDENFLWGKTDKGFKTPLPDAIALYSVTSDFYTDISEIDNNIISDTQENKDEELEKSLIDSDFLNSEEVKLKKENNRNERVGELSKRWANKWYRRWYKKFNLDILPQIQHWENIIQIALNFHETENSLIQAFRDYCEQENNKKFWISKENELIIGGRCYNLPSFIINQIQSINDSKLAYEIIIMAARIIINKIRIKNNLEKKAIQQ